MSYIKGPIIYVMCGPIASGKSTWSKTKAQTGAIVVNDDAIVTALHGGDYKLYEEPTLSEDKIVRVNRYYL